MTPSPTRKLWCRGRPEHLLAHRSREVWCTLSPTGPGAAALSKSRAKSSGSNLQTCRCQTERETEICRRLLRIGSSLCPLVLARSCEKFLVPAVLPVTLTPLLYAMSCSTHPPSKKKKINKEEEEENWQEILPTNTKSIEQGGRGRIGENSFTFSKKKGVKSG